MALGVLLQFKKLPTSQWATIKIIDKCIVTASRVLLKIRINSTQNYDYNDYANNRIQYKVEYKKLFRRGLELGPGSLK